MDETRSALIAEQMKHALANLRADLDAVKAQSAHDRELGDHRLRMLEDQARDHELRIRQATDGVVQFKVWSGLASGGSGIVSLVALLKAFLGG